MFLLGNVDNLNQVLCRGKSNYQEAECDIEKDAGSVWQVGILLKQWKERLNDIRRNQRSYSADGEYDKPDRGTTGTYKGDVFAFPFNILPSRGVFFL